MNNFWQDRIEATKLQIAAYEDAVLALASTDVQSYSLDTGQTNQTVTKKDVTKLNNVINSLYNKLTTLEARVYGGQVTVRPCW